jgi:hypothetical protein
MDPTQQQLLALLNGGQSQGQNPYGAPPNPYGGGTPTPSDNQTASLGNYSMTMPSTPAAMAQQNPAQQQPTDQGAYSNPYFNQQNPTLFNQNSPYQFMANQPPMNGAMSGPYGAAQ